MVQSTSSCSHCARWRTRCRLTEWCIKQRSGRDFHTDARKGNKYTMKTSQYGTKVREGQHLPKIWKIEGVGSMWAELPAKRRWLQTKSDGRAFETLTVTKMAFARNRERSYPLPAAGLQPSPLAPHLPQRGCAGPRSLTARRTPARMPCRWVPAEPTTTTWSTAIVISAAHSAQICVTNDYIRQCSRTVHIGGPCAYSPGPRFRRTLDRRVRIHMRHGRSGERTTLLDMEVIGRPPGPPTAGAIAGRTTPSAGR